MPKYRKKPVVIEAVRITEDPISVQGFDQSALVMTKGGKVEYVMVETLEGTMRGEVGDYLIRGIKGEVYPCKPDIFEATYERVA